MSLLRRNWVYLRVHCVATIITGLFLFHPAILKTMLSAFACKEIEEGEYWLVDDLDIRCWHGNHTEYVLFIAFPGFIIWGLMSPLLVAIPLVKNRKNLN